MITYGEPGNITEEVSFSCEQLFLHSNWRV